ncbi:hypothetical protein [Halogeometricum limi]|uniref:CARDB protein n=1 Tax=Halogeometricum limi TaxID=555875 RepID=A0A1I6G0A1_9EURY|nr:hypothetical protein [Halogeometricum limi]SFR35624.1 hypothetical protein SAMN04488124_0647 [Halogeometricum limi]
MVRILTLCVALLLVCSGFGVVAADATVQTTTETPSAPTDQSENATDERQFDFSVGNVTNCGLTCRDVTVTAVNTGDEAAANVTVATWLLAGDTVVWNGTETVDSLDANESVTVTKRVQVGFFDALAVMRNDGYVTANTTVSWDAGEEAFSERRKVM